jgi:hypothetical protein
MQKEKQQQKQIPSHPSQQVGRGRRFRNDKEKNGD